MKKITRNELNEILKEHKKWLHGNGGKQADLRYADLRGADLRYADLRGANLSNADLSGADLRYADLKGVKFNEYTSFLNLQCPEEGSFIGFKKCTDNSIVKLKILKDAKRSSATTRKCRASKAKVLEILDENGNEISQTFSCHDDNFIYKVGETVSVDDFDEDRWNECATGIHFFITKQEAINY